jgi:hypothetical protein
MPENIPLQQRAGRNIGTEVLPPFINGGAMPEIAVNPTGATTIMEGQEGVVRTPCHQVGILPGTDGPSFGAVINQNTDDYDIGIFFVDDENNEILIGSLNVLADENAPLNLEQAYLAGGAVLGLCPGEKIILRSAVAQP